jgi:hypothetical protein
MWCSGSELTPLILGLLVALILKMQDIQEDKTCLQVSVSVLRILCCFAGPLNWEIKWQWFETKLNVCSSCDRQNTSMKQKSTLHNVQNGSGTDAYLNSTSSCFTMFFWVKVRDWLVEASVLEKHAVSIFRTEVMSQDSPIKPTKKVN